MQQLPIEVREFLSFIYALVEVVGVALVLLFISVVLVQVARGAIDDSVRLARYVRDRILERKHAKPISYADSRRQVSHR